MSFTALTSEPITMFNDKGLYDIFSVFNCDIKIQDRL